MLFSKPITEVIQQRFSCRTYLDRPIEKQKRQQLRQFASSAQMGPFGTHARFDLVAATDDDRKALRELGTYGFIRGATGFLIGATKNDEKDLEDFGYLMERIVLYATDLGLGTCWLGGTFTKSSFARQVRATDAESVPAVASVGYIAEKPLKVDSLIRKRAGSEGRLPWGQIFFDTEFLQPLSPEAAGAFATPLEMVRLGPSASNKQPWRIVKEGSAWHFYLQRTRGYRDSRVMKLMKVADMQRIDMGIAMSHFELAAKELNFEGIWAIREPNITKPDELTEYLVSWLG
jgi:hypothetical protein